MTNYIEENNLETILENYKQDPNPLNTLAVLTKMSKATLYGIRMKDKTKDTADQDQSGISWLTYETKDNHQQLVTYTNEEEAKAKLVDDQRKEVASISFKQIALMVLTETNPIESFVVNPDQQNANFNQNIIEKIWQYTIKHV